MCVKNSCQVIACCVRIIEDATAVSAVVVDIIITIIIIIIIAVTGKIIIIPYILSRPESEGWTCIGTHNDDSLLVFKNGCIFYCIMFYNRDLYLEKVLGTRILLRFGSTSHFLFRALRRR